MKNTELEYIRTYIHSCTTILASAVLLVGAGVASDPAISIIFTIMGFALLSLGWAQTDHGYNRRLWGCISGWEHRPLSELKEAVSEEDQA